MNSLGFIYGKESKRYCRFMSIGYGDIKKCCRTALNKYIAINRAMLNEEYNFEIKVDIENIVLKNLISDLYNSPEKVRKVVNMWLYDHIDRITTFTSIEKSESSYSIDINIAPKIDIKSNLMKYISNYICANYVEKHYNKIARKVRKMEEILDDTSYMKKLNLYSNLNLSNVFWKHMEVYECFLKTCAYYYKECKYTIDYNNPRYEEIIVRIAIDNVYAIWPSDSYSAFLDVHFIYDTYFVRYMMLNDFPEKLMNEIANSTKYFCQTY